jgi:hypothetical protein
MIAPRSHKNAFNFDSLGLGMDRIVQKITSCSEEAKEAEVLEQVKQDQTRLIEEKEMNQNLLTQAAEYEQELYDKDQYIEGLKNEIRGLRVSPSI